jgi:hypothetical protein
MTPEVTKIGNKLFDKVELASERIELGVAQDMKKTSDDLYNNVSQIQTKMIVLGDDLKPLLEKLKGEKEKAIELQAKSKELGIDEAVKIFNNFQNDFLQTEKLAKKLYEYSYNARKGV